MKTKQSIEYHLWFLLTLIATILSALVITNAWWRAGAVSIFAILCHLFGQKEGELITKATAAAEKEAQEKARLQAEADDNDHADDDTFVLKP